MLPMRDGRFMMFRRSGCAAAFRHDECSTFHWTCDDLNSGSCTMQLQCDYLVLNLLTLLFFDSTCLVGVLIVTLLLQFCQQMIKYSCLC